jgi:hypothetical protein
VLVALHLDHGQPRPPTRTTDPGTQQRGLPTPSRSRDDRHLPPRRPIQHGQQLTPVDQPRTRPIHLHGPPSIPAQRPLPDPTTLGSRPTHQLSTTPNHQHPVMPPHQPSGNPRPHTNPHHHQRHAQDTRELL